MVLGPDRLPGYAAQAARLIRQVRTLADNVKDHAREQIGPEFDDIDWKSLDPRQYDPRRVIREAMHGEGDANAATRGATPPSATSGPPPREVPARSRLSGRGSRIRRGRYLITSETTSGATCASGVRSPLHTFSETTVPKGYRGAK